MSRSFPGSDVGPHIAKLSFGRGSEASGLRGSEPEKPPLVSVVVPVFNALPYLDEALASLVDQSYSNIEIIAVDDGSTDSSSQTLARWASRDRRIRVLTQERAGLVLTLKNGCAAVRGRYLARLDADDVALTNRIERQVEYLEAHPDVALLGGGAIFLDDGGTPFAEVAYPAHHEDLVDALETSCPFVHSAVMMRTEAFRAVGGYRELFPRGEDYDLWLRFSERFKVANLGEPLVGYRIHGHQTTLSTLDDEARWSLVARAAHRARTEKGRDPVEDGPRRSFHALSQELGIDELQVTSARIDARVWYAKTLTRAGAVSAADTVWTEAQQLAGELPDAGSRQAEVAEIRTAVTAERRRARWRLGNRVTRLRRGLARKRRRRRTR
jgi:hypothetical protein